MSEGACSVPVCLAAARAPLLPGEGELAAVVHQLCFDVYDTNKLDPPPLENKQRGRQTNVNSNGPAGFAAR